MVKGYTLFIAIILTIFYIYLVSLKSYATKMYMISVYIFAGFVLLFLIWGFIVYFIDAWVKRKKPSYFFRKKEKYFFEYVYQRLNKHPSNFWVNKKQKLGMEIEGHYNIYPKYKNSDLNDEKLLIK